MDFDNLSASCQMGYQKLKMICPVSMTGFNFKNGQRAKVDRRNIDPQISKMNRLCQFLHQDVQCSFLKTIYDGIS